jgi:hypothetical protein
MRYFVARCLVAGSWLTLSACGHGHSHHHHHDKPDTGTPSTTTEEPIVAPISCRVIERQEEEEGILPRGACSPAQELCELGRECCCDRCAPNVVCQCSEGQWLCYYTDFCAIPFCPDGGLGPDGGWLLGR